MKRTEAKVCYLWVCMRRSRSSWCHCWRSSRNCLCLCPLQLHCLNLPGTQKKVLVLLQDQNSHSSRRLQTSLNSNTSPCPVPLPWCYLRQTWLLLLPLVHLSCPTQQMMGLTWLSSYATRAWIWNSSAQKPDAACRDTGMLSGR